LALIKKYWFLAGLLLIFAVTLADFTETAAGAGRWFKAHQGPNAVIFIIFLFSGMVLEAEQIKAGLRDVTGTLVALVVIYVFAPLLGLAFSWLPLEEGVIVGIFLVACMPTTLSSGVVMTGAAGGNIAHALLITVVANSLAVLTVPVTLALLLGGLGDGGAVHIDKGAIMLKIAVFVFLPLILGLLVKWSANAVVSRFTFKLQVANQLFILFIVWMAVSGARETILQGAGSIGVIVVVSFVFHGMLLASAVAMIRLFSLGRGRREGVLFMGGQKTLTLAILLQVSLFPQYGAALVVCVVHHIVHLMMDGYLVGRLNPGK